MKESTMLALGALWFLSQDSKAKAAPSRRRPGRAVEPRANWDRFLAEAGATPELTPGLKRAAALRSMSASPLAARQLFDAFKSAWFAARKLLPSHPPTKPEDQLYFSVLQITAPEVLKGSGTTNARQAHREMLQVYKGDDRMARILAAASHVAWGTPIEEARGEESNT